MWEKEKGNALATKKVKREREREMKHHGIKGHGRALFVQYGQCNTFLFKASIASYFPPIFVLLELLLV